MRGSEPIVCEPIRFENCGEKICIPVVLEQFVSPPITVKVQSEDVYIYLHKNYFRYYEYVTHFLSQ